MFNFESAKHVLLSTPSGELGCEATGKDLTELVNERGRLIKSLPKRLTIITASPTIEFVADLLAHLENEYPIAILGENLTQAEKSNCLAVADESKLNPLTSLVLFTSGSTGQPRAVQLSRNNISCNIQAVIKSLKFREATSQTLFLPLSYSFGLLGQLLPALSIGIRTNLLPSLASVPQFISKNGMEGMWSGVPSHWIALTQLLASQSSLTVAPSHIVSAGGRLDLEVRKKLVSLFPKAEIFNNYGLTEASPRLLSLSSKSPNFLTESVGYPVGDWKVRINDGGELEATGSQVMLGYLGDQSRSHLHDGWLRTGDLASISEDGCVTIQGRADHQVKVSGERMSLAEIESVICSIEGVENACVLAIPHPTFGNSLEAYIQLRTPIARAELIKSLKLRLSAHKIPQRFFAIKKMPFNANGKVDRRAVESLRDQAQSIQ